MVETKKKPGRPSGSKNKNTSTSKASGKAQTKSSMGNRVKDEISAIIMMAIGVFLVLALQTGAAGIFGQVVSDFLKGSFGMLAFVLPYYLILYAILLFLRKTVHIDAKSILLLMLIFLMMTLLNSGRYIDLETFSFKELTAVFDAGVAQKNGGFFGMMLGALLTKVIGKAGLYIISSVVIAIALLLIINTPVSQFFEKMKLRKDIKEADAEAAYQAQLEMEEVEVQTVVAEPVKKKRDKVLDKKNEKVVPVDIPEPDIVPGYVLGKMSDGQRKIMDYMKADDLFEVQSGTNDTMGIELATQSAFGYGLDGSPAPIEDGDTELSTDLADSTIGKSKKLSSIDAKTTFTPEEINMSSAAALMKQYLFPSTNLLNKAQTKEISNIDGNLKAKAAKLEETLQNFNVDARVVQVTQGPAVTRYEIQPNVGVKVSSIVRLSDDIALNLKAKSIRIEAPIPGKAAVGIEVENDRINMVLLREIVDSKEFKASKSKITFAVGKDIAGNSIVADLKGMPHLLIAGSTGSGKSVCINSIIMSILYKASPAEVKLVLIDPKVVELGNYNGIPHMLIPVVTEPSKAAAALNWAVAEMTDRYKKFAEEGVRDLESYNNSLKKKKGLDLVLPQIVIIIDELADLMMAAPSQVEESICRLAQMARAAGMHLIVATQRPSVDVITGVIKANIPSRIAFAVSSQFDSRTILDMGGAEKLVGKGDMLFNPLGMGKPIRVQGTFISDTEVHKVIEYVKGQCIETEYASDVIHTIEKAGSQTVDADSDELLSEAIETVVKTGQASVSMLQRRFRIGYNRAARIVDMMESRGIIGPADGSRPRQVLMTETELYGTQNGTEETEA